MISIKKEGMMEGNEIKREGVSEINKGKELEKKDVTAEQIGSAQEKFKIENQVQAGASWFFWIAGLSIINSIILLSGGNWNFIAGLGATQVIDYIANGIGPVGKIIAFILDVFIAGIFILFGIFAKKKQDWSFIAGMIVYALDGVLFLLNKDMLGAGFHIFALYCIFSGFNANRKLREIDNAAA